MKLSMTPSLSKFFECDIPVEYKNLVGTGEIAFYRWDTDIITLCTTLEKEFPFHRQIVFLHEMFHASGGTSRSYRRERLSMAFKKKAYAVEECIVEIATMVAMKKLGWFTEYARVIPEQGLKTYYNDDIFIPWMEVVMAVEKFKTYDTDFSQELSYMRKYLTEELKINIEDRYARTSDYAT